MRSWFVIGVSWLLIGTSLAGDKGLTSPEREREILQGLTPRPAVWAVHPNLDYPNLAGRVSRAVAQICEGDPAVVEQQTAELEVLLASVDPVLAAVLDDGNVDAMRGLLTIDEAGWRSASVSLQTGPCLVELRRWKERAQRLSGELMRADQQAQVLLLEEVTTTELAHQAAGARPGPRARLQARIDAIRAGVAWGKALAAEITAAKPADKAARCALLGHLPYMTEEVNDALIEAIRVCERAGL